MITYQVLKIYMSFVDVCVKGGVQTRACWPVQHFFIKSMVSPVSIGSQEYIYMYQDCIKIQSVPVKCRFFLIFI